MKKEINKKPFVHSAACFTVCLVFSFYMAGCDDSTINDNNNPGACSKVTNLQRPPSDTTISGSSVDFSWSVPTCGAPRYYKLIVYSGIDYDTVIAPYNFASINLSPQNRYYWKVYSFYGTPVNDSTLSATYDFFLEP